MSAPGQELSIKLGDLDLVKREQPSAAGPYTEVRSVSAVDVDDRRDVVELGIPGAEGGVLQDMGRRAIRIRVTGEVWGETAWATLSSLKEKSDASEALAFTSSLVSATDVNNVVIERLVVDQTAGIPDRYRYTLFLKEYKGETGEDVSQAEPGTEEEAPPDQTEEAEEEAEKEIEVDDISGQVLDSTGEPAANVPVLIAGPDGERVVTTDEEGKYQVQDVPDGEYLISVSQEGFEKETVVNVRKGAGGGAP